MKRSGVLMAAFASLLLISCSRDADLLPNPGTLEGSWRMVIVKDNFTGLSHTKPGAITGEVKITFVAVEPRNGFFNGKTPTNVFSGDEYTVGDSGKLTIPTIASTDAIETSWGLDFFQNITKSDNYSIEPDGKLRIYTGKKTLYFERD